MLYAVILFLIFSLVAGVLGFTGISIAFAGMAKILFYLFIILFFVSLIMYVVNGHRPRL